jgi:ketosteroid isomerase-like protein
VERVAADGHDRPDQEEAEMDSQAAARRWAATWTAAWQAHDVEAVVALYAEDCVHRSTPFRPPHRGRQSVRGYLTQAFADEQRIDYWHLQNGHQPPPDWDR